MCLAVPARVAALLENQWVEIEVGGIHTREIAAHLEKRIDALHPRLP
jgi:hydrogenase maturation factor